MLIEGAQRAAVMLSHLRPLVQQQLHTVSVGHHAGAVQRLQRAVHAVHIGALGRQTGAVSAGHQGLSRAGLDGGVDLPYG